jgi:hypothetical protein
MNMRKKLFHDEFQRNYPKPIRQYTVLPRIYVRNTFQDLPRLRETADNTERYI